MASRFRNQYSSARNEAFRWTPATGAVRLGRFGTGSNATSTATAVSGDGAIIGGAGHPILTGAVIWDASNTPTIVGGLPGDTNGAITALSRDGTVAAGNAVDAAGHERAFRWTFMGEVVPLATSSTFVATIASRHFGRRPAYHRLGERRERSGRCRRPAAATGTRRTRG